MDFTAAATAAAVGSVRSKDTSGRDTYMDCRTGGGHSDGNGGKYTSLDAALLPEMYLVYNIDLGGCRERSEAGVSRDGHHHNHVLSLSCCCCAVM